MDACHSHPPLSLPVLISAMQLRHVAHSLQSCNCVGLPSCCRYQHSALMQDPYKEGRQLCLQIQHRLAGILAAAVHVGLISAQEGICDVIDAIGSRCVLLDADKGQTEVDYLTEPSAQWPRYIAEEYMAPSMPGTYLPPSKAFTTCDAA